MTTPATNVGTSVSDAPPVAPAKPRGRRAWRWVTGIVVAIFALAGVAYWKAHRIADETIDRHRTTLAHEEARLSALPRARPAMVVPSIGETADGILARFEETRRSAGPDWETIASADDDPPNAPEPEELDRVLAKHAATLVLLRDVLRAPSAATSRLPTKEKSAWGNGNVLRAMHWVDAALGREIARGERARALDDLALLATLAADTEREGTLAARREGERMQAYAAERLTEVLALGPVDLESARRLAHALDVIDACRPPLKNLCEVVRASLRAEYVDPEGASDAGSQDRFVRRAEWRHLWSEKIRRAQVLDACDERIDDVARVLASDAEDLRGASEAARGPLSSGESARPKQLISLQITLQSEIGKRCSWRMARAALAVAIYRQEKGTFPPSLDSLVSTHLPRVPLDPLDGKPLRYSASPVARVWSVGHDRTDDGGKPYADPDDESGPGDIVFTIGPEK